MVETETLLRKIGQDIASYLMAGKKGQIPGDVFDHFSYEGLEKYADIEKLLRTHFIIQEDIMNLNLIPSFP